MKNLFARIVMIVSGVCISMVAFISVVNLCTGTSDSYVDTLLENEILDDKDKNNKNLEFKKKFMEKVLRESFPDRELTLEFRVNDKDELTGADLVIDSNEKSDAEFDDEFKKRLADELGISMEKVMITENGN